MLAVVVAAEFARRSPKNPARIEDAVRLCNEGLSIRQVAERCEYGYGVMRRMLSQHVPLRNRGGAYRT